MEGVLRISACSWNFGDHNCFAHSLWGRSTYFAIVFWKMSGKESPLNLQASSFSIRYFQGMSNFFIYEPYLMNRHIILRKSYLGTLAKLQGRRCWPPVARAHRLNRPANTPCVYKWRRDYQPTRDCGCHVTAEGESWVHISFSLMLGEKNNQKFVARLKMHRFWSGLFYWFT